MRSTTALISRHQSLKIKYTSSTSKLHKGFRDFANVFNKMSIKTSISKERSYFSDYFGGRRLEMRFTLALSTSIPLFEMIWPKTIPYFTVKWHFSQFKTKFFFIYLCRNSVRWCKHW